MLLSIFSFSFITFAVYRLTFAITYITINVIDSETNTLDHIPFNPNNLGNTIKQIGKNTIDLNKQIKFENFGISIA